MIRYDDTNHVKNPVDYKKVSEAVATFLIYVTDVLGHIRTDMNVTVDNGNVFFYSRKTAQERYFVEVKPATKTIKIILSSPEHEQRMTEVTQCQDQLANGRSENSTQP